MLPLSRQRLNPEYGDSVPSPPLLPWHMPPSVSLSFVVSSL